MSYPFAWPDGKRAAVSISFDDARPTQPTTGLPILDEYHSKATFYVSFLTLEEHLDAWHDAVANGHEIGNHTVTHPCSGNFGFSRHNALEEYTLERMASELDGANAKIQELLGVTPRTFAYPCGQTFVGRGEELQSYVPLVAQRFLAGRGFKGESANDPQFCDLSLLMGTDADDRTLDSLMDDVENALRTGGWLVLCGHNVGTSGYQTVHSDALVELCRYAQNEKNGLWLDTVETIAQHIEQARS